MGAAKRGNRGRRGGRRRWSDEDKARMVSESLVAGARVSEVARRHGVRAQQLSSWRALARRGELVLVPTEEARYATLEVVEPGRESAAVAIEAFGITVHLGGESSARRIAEVVAELRTLR